MKPERRDIIINPRARKWQWLAVFSGLLLAASFFMPCVFMAFPFQTLHMSPFQSVCHAFHLWDGSYSPLLVRVFYLNSGLQRSGSVYALGGSIALGALGRLWRKRSLATAASWLLLAVLLSYCLLPPMVILTAHFYPDYVPGLDLPNFLRNPLGDPATIREGVLSPTVALVYVLLSLKHGERGHLCRAFLSSLWAFIFFAWIMVHHFPMPGQLYGRYVASTAAALLLLGTVGEMAAATAQSWPQSVGQFLLCRPAPPMDMRGRCPACGYHLYGLRDLRCPECGRPFTLEEIHLTAGDSPTPADPRG